MEPLPTGGGDLTDRHPSTDGDAPIYGLVARVYRAAGWRRPVPVPRGRKFPPPEGYTGAAGAEPDDGLIEHWMTTRPADNVALVLDDDLVGVDVDAYAGGLATIAGLEAGLGRLAPTWTSTSREDGSGIRFYRALRPLSRHLPGELGPGVQIVQRAHRYAVVWPSIHPKGPTYRWLSPSGEGADRVPAVAELAELGASWFDHLEAEAAPAAPKTAEAAPPSVLGPVTRRRHPEADWGRWDGRVVECLTLALRDMAGGRHPATRDGLAALARYEVRQLRGAAEGIEHLGQCFVDDVVSDGSRTEAEADRELRRMVVGARQKVATTATLADDEAGPQPEDLVGPEAGRIEEPPGKDEASRDRSREATSWAPIDLRPALEGSETEPPAILARTDERRLLYRGRVHWLLGESESCKSWAAQIATAEVLGRGGRALYVDFEDDERAVIGRLRALRLGPLGDECGPEAIAERMVYLRPDEPLADRRGNPTPAMADLDGVLEAGPYDLVVIDGVTEAMVTEGLDLVDNTDVAVWMRRVPKMIANRTAASVAVVDHVAKDAGGGRFAIGGQHKIAGLTGAAYLFQTVTPIGRATLVPVRGTVSVTVTKDRPGHVRGWAEEGSIGTLELCSDPDGTVRARIEPPGVAGPPVDMALAHRILSHLVIYDRDSRRGIAGAMGGREGHVGATLSAIAERGWILVDRSRQTHEHYLTDLGRAQLGGSA